MELVELVELEKLEKREKRENQENQEKPVLYSPQKATFQKTLPHDNLKA